MGDGTTIRSLKKLSTHINTQSHHHHNPTTTQPLFRPETLPAWYESAYQSLAIEGTRVLALGYKPLLPPKDDNESAAAGAEEDRGHVEQGLAFAGFAAFRTQIRTDSRRIVKQLKDAGACVC